MLSPYWPMIPGSWIESVMFDIRGNYNPSTGEIGITWQQPRKTFWTDSTEMRTTCIIDRNAQVPAVRRINGPVGVVLSPDMDMRGQGLYEGPWFPAPGDDQVPPHIGETGGVDFICTPPEPKLTLNPVAGQVFDVSCHYRSFARESADVPYAGWIDCRHITHHVGQSWGQHADTVRTHLIERPGAAHEIAYNYVFARDIGPVDWWWGVVGHDGGALTVAGWRIYATKWGG